jgi:hypothetical protein
MQIVKTPTIRFVYYYNARQKIEEHEVLKETPSYLFTLRYKIHKKTQLATFINAKTPSLQKRFFFTRDEIVRHLLTLKCQALIVAPGLKLKANLSAESLRDLYAEIVKLRAKYFLDEKLKLD